MKRRLLVCFAACFLVLLLVQAGWAQNEPTSYETILKMKAPSIVTVKFVMKVSGFRGGDEREVNREVQGAIVDSSGLVMVNNSAINPSLGRMGRSGRSRRGGGGGGGTDAQATASNIRVVFEKDEKEYEAIVGATDSKLDLAFIIIKDFGDKKVHAVDFSDSAEVEIGKEYIGISRHPRGFDYAPYFGTLQVTGKVEVPRTLWSVSDTFDNALGLPLFNGTGKVVGVLTRQEGSEGATSERGGGRFFGGLMGRSGSIFLVPADDLKSVIPQALERSKKALEKAKKEEEDMEF